MISVLLSLAVLVCGYLFYGRAVARAFGPDDRQTPAYRLEDGVDFVPMKTDTNSLSGRQKGRTGSLTVPE